MSRPVSEHESSAESAGGPARVQPPPVDPGELARCLSGTRRLASALLGAESLGEDAAQDVILAALQRPPRVERGLGAWFAGALRRRALHLQRSQSRRAKHHLQSLDERRVPEPHEALARAEIVERLVAAVRALPDPYRDPILLHYLEEHDTREVAERLGRPLSTVQTQLQRGLALLRERFAAGERSRRSDWRDALALVCLPRPGAIRARIDEVERELVSRSPRRVGRFARFAWIGAALIGVWLGARLVRAPSDAENAALEVAEHARSASSNALAPDELPPRRSAGAAAFAQASTPSPAAVESAELVGRSLRLVVRDAATRAPIALARAFVDRSESPRVSSTPRAEDRASAHAADDQGALELALDPPCWVRVEAPGHTGALLSFDVRALDESRGAIEVELDVAPVLEVVAERGARLLAAKAWRPSVFPVATPPFELEGPRAPDDETPHDAQPGAQAHATLALAPGRWIVSALCERDGKRLVDSAQIELDPISGARWKALDGRESDVEITLARPLGPQERWSAALLLGSTRQMGALAVGQGDARLRWSSAPAGEHELVLALESGEIARQPLSIGSAPSQEVRVDLPRAQLSIDLQIDEGTSAMCILHGPLERARAQRRTHVRPGPHAHFAALAPGRYEAWLRTPRGFGRSELSVVEGAQHAALREEQGARSMLHYRGECELDRQEIVLLAQSGARLPITFGSYGDAAWARGFSSPDHEAHAQDGSVTVALPAGEYELLCTVDGEHRLSQRVRLEPGASAALGASALPRSIVLTFTRAGRAIAHQLVELAGSEPGATPLDPAPGALWMNSPVTDAEGRIELALAPAHWTAMLAGGALLEFDVGAATSELVLAFPLARDAAR